LVSAVGVTAIFVSIMLSHTLGPWGVIVAISLTFFGIYNWLFEKGYSEFTTPQTGGHH
jgi:uncharacterized membrane protein